jgi:glycosyltransferase involved in cell wall biosynthesis
MNNKIGRVLWVLKNEGPAAMGAKTAMTIRRTIAKQRATSLSDSYLYLSNPLFDVTDQDIRASQESSNKELSGPKSAIWFVPYFDHVTYGGIYTIFRFIEAFSLKGLRTTVVIFDNKYFDVDKMKRDVSHHFPGLADVEVINFDPGQQPISSLPARDIAFATIWMSAYVLLKYNKAKRKYYFIQDYEPLFYEAGSMYALAESTYRFGFRGLVNTPGLLWALNQRHGLEGISFIPAVDKRYSPAGRTTKKDKVRIFFYARPKNPRNAFELGILTIKELKKKYGDKIEVITAGANWNEADYGLVSQITNLGLLSSLEEVSNLYRSCDIGFVYMLSKHPSYQPFEFMACGMATVTNRNEDNLWLFKDGENCLLAEPSPAAMVEKIGRLIDDAKLRQKIASAGQKNVNFDWQTEIDKTWGHIRQS